MKSKISFLICIFFLFICCKQNASQEIYEEVEKTSIKTINNTKQNIAVKNTQINQSEIIGIWTDGNSENAIFEIKNKSIYYIDNFQEFKYKLQNDTIEIEYADYIYRAGIQLKNDSLIMNSREYGKATYSRFK